MIGTGRDERNPGNLNSLFGERATPDAKECLKHLRPEPCLDCAREASTTAPTFTPGPWKIDRHLGMIVGPDGGPITGEANYTLAAAAPDLFAAAEQALNYIANTEGEFDFELDSGIALRAALAKARGEMA